MAGTAEPTWSRPPPAVPSSPSLTRLGRWLFKGGGPVERAALAIFDASPTAMPWIDGVPRDGDLGASADPAALARFLSTVASGMGVLASSGADREALRQVARVSLGAFPEATAAR